MAALTFTNDISQTLTLSGNVIFKANGLTGDEFLKIQEYVGTTWRTVPRTEPGYLGTGIVLREKMASAPVLCAGDYRAVRSSSAVTGQYDE